MFQLVGYPCSHAIASISYHRLDIEDYINDYFKKDAYMRVYRHMINPVPGMHDFEKSNLGTVDPPQVKVRAGRPKKVRRRDGNDIRDNDVVSRNGLTHTCAKCLVSGHNKRSCKNPPHPNSKYYKIPMPIEDISQVGSSKSCHVQQLEVSTQEEHLASEPVSKTRRAQHVSRGRKQF
ncbi:UNVERIFIED_CONTAM: hypothetical protein Sangu_2699600 [Sesamum angustifolium]|uniref:SWIM-type domain-containing protein n=1 Tax=Sesamum angustifolium TaxID=2727405 RepID=A0AAW2IYC8_9LAMI